MRNTILSFHVFNVLDDMLETFIKHLTFGSPAILIMLPYSRLTIKYNGSFTIGLILQNNKII